MESAEKDTTSAVYVECTRGTSTPQHFPETEYESEETAYCKADTARRSSTSMLQMWRRSFTHEVLLQGHCMSCMQEKWDTLTKCAGPRSVREGPVEELTT